MRTRTRPEMPTLLSVLGERRDTRRRLRLHGVVVRRALRLLNVFDGTPDDLRRLAHPARAQL